VDILLAVVPVFLVVAAGAAARRLRFLGDPFIDTANALVYYLLLPALLFHEISGASFRSAFSARLVAGGYFATTAVFFLAFVLSGRMRMTPAERGAFVQGAFRANLAYVGLPIVLGAAGKPALAKAGILLGFMVPLLNALAVVALVLPHGGGKTALDNARRIARQLAVNPIILSSALGTAFSLLALRVPALLDRTLGLLSQATLPLSLLCLGASFSLEKARAGLAGAALAASMKLVLLTALALAAYRAMGVGGEELRVGVIMMGCPTAVVTYVMASQLAGDVALAGAIVILSTAASAATITGWLFLLRLLGW